MRLLFLETKIQNYIIISNLDFQDSKRAIKTSLNYYIHVIFLYLQNFTSIKKFISSYATNECNALVIRRKKSREIKMNGRNKFFRWSQKFETKKIQKITFLQGKISCYHFYYKQFFSTSRSNTNHQKTLSKAVLYVLIYRFEFVSSQEFVCTCVSCV